MNKIFATILILLGAIPAMAEEIDSVWLSATYHVTLKTRMGEGAEDCTATLDIGHKGSAFYNEHNRRFEYLRDSLDRANASIASIADMLTGDMAPNNSMKYEVYKNYPNEGKLSYTDYIYKWKFHYNEDIPQID